jgi:hypothetical protein
MGSAPYASFPPAVSALSDSILFFLTLIIIAKDEKGLAFFKGLKL